MLPDFYFRYPTERRLSLIITLYNAVIANSDSYYDPFLLEYLHFCSGWLGGCTWCSRSNLSSLLRNRSSRNFAISCLISLRSCGIRGCSSGLGQKFNCCSIQKKRKKLILWVHVWRIYFRIQDDQSSTWLQLVAWYILRTVISIILLMFYTLNISRFGPPMMMMMMMMRRMGGEEEDDLFCVMKFKYLLTE